ncbi:uncharacterized protein LOC124799139 [Schistocerca piceifrons]|uniref:uncharacterized protein LOC124799139 n=1 Tax=Schistocerca piceifrons TaxID=274613 RepID=UPI001F5F3DE5|nr:uncharacterized protein LOC124799139 [Schistocerca piceifrons]
MMFCSWEETLPPRRHADDSAPPSYGPLSRRRKGQPRCAVALEHLPFAVNGLLPCSFEAIHATFYIRPLDDGYCWLGIHASGHSCGSTMVRRERGGEPDAAQSAFGAAVHGRRLAVPAGPLLVPQRLLAHRYPG